MVEHRRDTETRDREWLARIPKVELHLHLEGAIPLPTLWTLIEKYGGDPDVPSPEALERRFTYRDFPHFIQTWLWKQSFLREYEDFTLLAEAVARDLVAQNVRYVEAFTSPADVTPHDLEAQPLIRAIRTGLDRVPEIRVALVPDLVRNKGPQEGAETLERVAECRDLGGVGVGLGGSEHDFPPEPYESVYRRARELGLRTSAHAGEAAGPESVWGAIRALRVDRIGHGTRAVEDPALVDYLAEHRIPLELCPISNVRTGVIESIREHPARTYLERGIPLSVNTDDPKMFGNTLVDEFAALMSELDFTRVDVCRLTFEAIDASWLVEPDKVELRRSIDADPAWISD
jgi:adenosine deaminase